MVRIAEFNSVKEAKSVAKDRMKWYNKMMDAKVGPITPEETSECDSLDRLRKEFNQPASAPYLSLMRLARKLEKERNQARAEVRRLTER